MTSGHPNNTAKDTPRARARRVLVLVRLTPDQHRDMKVAMAVAGIRSNQQFVEEAVTVKTLATLNPRRRGAGVPPDPPDAAVDAAA